MEGQLGLRDPSMAQITCVQPSEMEPGRNEISCNSSTIINEWLEIMQRKLSSTEVRLLVAYRVLVAKNTGQATNTIKTNSVLISKEARLSKLPTDS